MQGTTKLHSSSSEDEIKSLSMSTMCTYDCEWNGCEAMLNCWGNLEKHYRLHCQWAQKQHKHHRGCGLPACPLDKTRPITISNLVDHVSRTHLSRIRVPCPVADCDEFEPLDRVYDHYKSKHQHQSNITIALQSRPFIPPPISHQLPKPLDTSMPLHELMPLIGPSTRAKTRDEVEKSLTQEEMSHLTLWECFEYNEQPVTHEEIAMEAQDLDFEPLRRPKFSSNTNPWPSFVISPQKFPPSQKVQVSNPPMNPVPPSSCDLSQQPGPTFLYQAFKKYVQLQDTA